MKKILRNAGSILLMAVLSILVFSTAALAAEVPGIKMPVTMKLSSYKPNTPEELVVVLTAKDAACPMPAEAVDGVYSMTVSGEGVKEFPEITYPKVGVHEYTIHQEPGTHKRGTYDDTVYNVTVYVTNAENGGLETTTLIYIDGVEEKQGEIAFMNSYRRPPSDDDDDPKPTKPATEITDHDIPKDSGITDHDIPKDSGITDIIDEMIPLGPLPQTGTLWWLVPVLGAAGVMMFLTGLYRNRSCGRDDE